MKYTSLRQIESLVAGKEPVSYRSSTLARVILDDCWPGLRQTVLSCIPPEVITKGSKGKRSLASWLGTPSKSEMPDHTISQDVITFIKERFREIESQPYAKSQRHQVGWLANFAAQQDLGPLFSSLSTEGNEYSQIAWDKLPSWRMPR